MLNCYFPFKYLKFKIHVHHILGRKMIRARYCCTILLRKRLRCQTNDSYHNIFHYFSSLHLLPVCCKNIIQGEEMPIMWYNMGEWFYGTFLVQDWYFFILVYRQTKITAVSSHFLSILHSSHSLREVKYFLAHYNFALKL